MHAAVVLRCCSTSCRSPISTTDGAVRAGVSGAAAAVGTATNYLGVRAPADETLVSLPASLPGGASSASGSSGWICSRSATRRRSTPFSRGGSPTASSPRRARSGYRTEMAGYYLPYCSLLGDLVDACRSLSFYNASTVGGGFSPLNPIRTTLIMWPRQFPFGLLKNPPFARLQRGLVEDTRRVRAGRSTNAAGLSLRALQRAALCRSCSTRTASIRRSIRCGRRPTTPTASAATMSIAWSARSSPRMERAGTFDRTTFVVLADHGFRFGGRERDKLHIPFIVKIAGQQPHRRGHPERGEPLLKDVVEQSCGL